MEAISLIPGVGSVPLALFRMKRELGDTRSYLPWWSSAGLSASIPPLLQDRSYI